MGHVDSHGRRFLSLSLWLWSPWDTISWLQIHGIGFQPDELQDIKNFVLSGAVVGLGTTYIRRYLEER